MSLETSPNPLKRDHDVFEGFSQVTQLPELEQPFTVPADFLDTLESQHQKEDPTKDESQESLPTPPVSIGNKRDESPSRSTTGSLTDAGPDTPSRDLSPPPTTAPTTSNAAPPSSAFAAMTGSAPPPAKKAKLTFQEKELRRINKEIKDKERAEEKARKDAERQAQAEEKTRKEAEKEAEKKKREAEQEEKRAAKEAEKAAKEEKRKKKEEEKQKADEEKRKKDEAKRKKESSQMKLGNFFAIPSQPKRRSASVESSRGRSSMSPAPQSSVASLLSATAAAPSPSKHTPSKSKLSTYEKLFPDFFIQNGVTLAPTNRFERDEEASGAIQNTIDSYILGNRSPGRQRDFKASSLFHIPPRDVAVPRGRRRMPVREIMTDFYEGKASRPIDLTTDSQNSQIKRTTDLLKAVPMKFLKFQEDVRPPYRGTYTSRPVNGMAKLARNPIRRDLPDTNYDYDSEAEWIEDEDAEDLKSEGDEEEELDEDEDMEGFLDDEGDETSSSKRLVLQGDLEPISTGLCWEDRKKRNTNVKMVAYKMEVILGMFYPLTFRSTLLTIPDPNIKSIDPFSSSYWEPTPSTMDPPRIPLNSMKNTSLNFNGQTTKPVKSFFTTASNVLKNSPSPTVPPPTFAQPRANSKGKDGKPKKLLPPEDMEAFKAAIQGNDLSKVGLVEVLKKKFPGRTAASIKDTLEAVAVRGLKGQKESEKKWVLLEDIAAPLLAS
ncbi:related to chromatin assembly complex, subunit p90 [Phialocephala subalpina]|uniref:Related to chromatin assembly complex, subunit p90 n=1 Tax=Phialocephala subalpina TaxID=576137 RepID=A0A1L7WUX6_9HELO|nr:related to chromatin assembly complex, subunit p90 [Phialocephala subalpina]